MRYHKLHRHKGFEILMAVDSLIIILRLWHHMVWYTGTNILEIVRN